MRLLIDNALSPSVAAARRGHGHDVLHLRVLGEQAAPDERVFELAVEQQRVLVSADTDFGAILARRGSGPSLVLLRGEASRWPERQAETLHQVLSRVAADLADGAVVVIDGHRVRIRPLPFDAGQD